MSRTPVTLRRENRPQTQGMKPQGFWYSIGDEWKDWVKAEMPHWLGEHEYEVRTEGSKILILDSPEKILDFNDKYGCGNNIDWARIAENYDGIEINPYHWSLRLNLMWYYGWDVASGCVWNTTRLELAYIGHAIQTVDGKPTGRAGEVLLRQ